MLAVRHIVVLTRGLSHKLRRNGMNTKSQRLPSPPNKMPNKKIKRRIMHRRVH